MPRLAFTIPFALLGACGTDSVPNTDPEPDGGTQAPKDALVPGDGDAGPMPDASPATPCQEATQHSDFAWIEANVFARSCAVNGCHTGSNPSVLWLDAGRAYASLVDRPSTTQSGWVRVVPGSVLDSYLVVALGRAPGPPPRDGFMPLGADPLCDEMLDAIERWIAAGAQP